MDKKERKKETDQNPGGFPIDAQGMVGWSAKGREEMDGWDGIPWIRFQSRAESGRLAPSPNQLARRECARRDRGGNANAGTGEEEEEEAAVDGGARGTSRCGCMIFSTSPGLRLCGSVGAELKAFALSGEEPPESEGEAVGKRWPTLRFCPFVHFRWLITFGSRLGSSDHGWLGSRGTHDIYKKSI